MERERVGELDGIRAYAISLVFMVHFLSHYFDGSTNAQRLDFDALRITDASSFPVMLAKYFWASHYGVDLFFLLSGYLILRILARPGFSYVQFLKARFMRLYPALLCATAAYLLYMMEFWGKTFDPWTILGNLVLLQGIWELGVQPIIVPTWSLTFEWIFYLGFPLLLLLPGAKSGLRLRHIAVAAAVVLLILLAGQQYTRLLMFLLGAGFALVPKHAVRQVAALTPNWLVIVLYLLGGVQFALDQNWYHFIPVYLLTSGLLVAKVLSGEPSFCKVLSWEPLRRLGTISYSFYLFHGLGIVIFCDLIFPVLHAPRSIQFAVMLAGSYLFSIGMAAISYRLLERPYFERSEYRRQHRIWRHLIHRLGMRWRARRQHDLVLTRFPNRVAGAKVPD